MTELQCALRGANNERVALSDVAVRATLRDLLSEVTVTQTYRNTEQVNIEAVYTFPLPTDAVLLDFEVRLGERVLRGIVAERKEAEARYEDAVSSGDAAVMLEMLEPGLYTMNVGNLLAGETATITVRYALMYRWSGDSLRVMIPTTIAPRYGAARHQPHQVPESSLVVENKFSVQLEVIGNLRRAQFHSPSHAVQLTDGADRTTISLEQTRAVMDRDFVLQVRAPQAERSFAIGGRDGSGSAAIASFQPLFSGLRKPRALSLGIVIDCSGSMAGVSIEQAKRALGDIILRLEPRDQLNIVAFGSHVRAFAPHIMPCTPDVLSEARRFVDDLDANMGGTDIAPALEAARSGMRHLADADVFLITDGQVSEWENVVRAARASRHRHFTVGVGTAVAEAFVKGLARESAGACELVSPNESMADRIVRHFERLRAPRATEVTMQWPVGVARRWPVRTPVVFEGDTVVACAWFPEPLRGGEVVLEMTTEDGTVERQVLMMSAAPEEEEVAGVSTVARVAAALRLPSLDEASARQDAVHYRLTSPYTNWIAVLERAVEEKAAEAPALRKVSQTLAAGWGGTGAVPPAPAVALDAMLFSKEGVAPSPRRAIHLTAARATPSLDAPRLGSAKRAPGSEPMDIPSFIRRQVDDGEVGSHATASEFNEFGSLVDLINAKPTRLTRGQRVALLTEAGLTHKLEEARDIARRYNMDDEEAAGLVLAQLFESLEIRKALSRDALKQVKLVRDEAATLQSRGDGEKHGQPALAQRIISFFQSTPK